MAHPEASPSTYIVLQDKAFAQRNPKMAFYVRFVGADGQPSAEQLVGECTLPGAMRLARAKGLRPTHWYDSDARVMSTLPVLADGLTA